MINAKTINNIVIALMVMVTLYGTTTVVDAREFRTIRHIITPENRTALAVVGGDILSKEMTDLGLLPIDKNIIIKEVHRFFDAWNLGTLDAFLSPDFQDKDKLLDAISDTVPRDAKIRIQAITSSATISADKIEWQDGKTWFTRSTTVVVSVDTQLEFTTSTGFKKITGDNEYTFDVIEEYKEVVQ